MSEGSRFDRWLASWTELDESLPTYRVLLGLGILVITLPRHPWLAFAPEPLLNPPAGLPYLFPRPPGAWAVPAVNTLLVSTAVLFTLGVRWRLMGLLLTGSLLLLNTWAYAYGKVNHDILLVLTPAVLALGTSGRIPRGADAQPRTAGGFAAPLLALIVALAMVSAAVPKVLSGWLALDASATRFHVLVMTQIAGNPGVLAPLLLETTGPWFWSALDVMTIVVESAFLFALGAPRAFRIVCAAATVFHLGIALVMGIVFTSNVLVYGAFVRWDLVAARVRTAWPRLWRTCARVAGVAHAVRDRPTLTTILVVAVSAVWVGLWNPIRELQRAVFGVVYTEEALLIVAATLSVAYATSLVRRRNAAS